MRIIWGALFSILLLTPALAAKGCPEEGDSDFLYPVGNIIKFCGTDRPGGGGNCDQYLCTRCQANGQWTEDYVCSKPDR